MVLKRRALLAMTLLCFMDSSHAIAGEDAYGEDHPACDALLVHQRSVDWFRQMYPAQLPLLNVAAHNPSLHGALEGAGVAILSHNDEEISAQDGTYIGVKMTQSESQPSFTYVVGLASGHFAEISPRSILEMRFQLPPFMKLAKFAKLYSNGHEVFSGLLDRLTPAWLKQNIALLVAFPGPQQEVDTGLPVEGSLEGIAPYVSDVLDSRGHILQRAVPGMIYSVRTRTGILKRIPSHLILQFRSQ